MVFFPHYFDTFVFSLRFLLFNEDVYLQSRMFGRQEKEVAKVYQAVISILSMSGIFSHCLAIFVFSGLLVF